MPINPPIRVFKVDPLAAPKQRPASVSKSTLRAKSPTQQAEKPAAQPAPLPSATDLIERRKSVRPIPAPVAKEIDMTQAMQLWGQALKSK